MNDAQAQSREVRILLLSLSKKVMHMDHSICSIKETPHGPAENVKVVICGGADRTPTGLPSRGRARVGAPGAAASTLLSH